jgi:hypothetical protein
MPVGNGKKPTEPNYQQQTRNRNRITFKISNEDGSRPTATIRTSAPQVTLTRVYILTQILVESLFCLFDVGSRNVFRVSGAPQLFLSGDLSLLGKVIEFYSMPRPRSCLMARRQSCPPHYRPERNRTLFYICIYVTYTIHTKNRDLG